MTIDFEVPSQAVDNRRVTLSISAEGRQIATQALVAGANKITFALPQGTDNAAVTLSVDTPYVLPGADGRSVFGLMRGISLE
jgi:hypothetical protein